jgi:predicted AlkP superfamily pyrophosphatase or phosphodiesterase
VLLIGIDGCRFDAILYSQAKHLKNLIAAGDRCDVLGNRETKADTASGPGWSSILTGVWADRHQVFGNDFRGNRLQECPNLLQLVAKARPKAECVAIVTWAPIQEHILKGQMGCRLTLDGDKKGYKEGDRVTTGAAVEVMEKENPDLMFVHFGEVDSAGHGFGFHPKSPKYTNATEEVDLQLGRVLDALKARPETAQEDWFILVCTDHGGQGKGHGGGRIIPETRTGFLIVHGASAQKGKIAGKTTNADIVPTALTHLKIAIDPAWKLDGRAVGLK